MEAIVGIDLGTTNSEVALIRDRQPHVFAEEGDPILPSFVGLSEDGRLLVGKPAKNQWVLAPERTVKSIKRKMGQDVKVKLGDQEYRPQEISAMILRTLRERGISVFYSTHILDDVERVADYIAIMKSGRVVRQGSMAEMMSADRLRFRLTVELPAEGLAKMLQQLPVVKAVNEAPTTEPGRIALLVDVADAGQAKRAIPRAVIDGGFVIMGCAPERTRLEDVFLDSVTDAAT